MFNRQSCKALVLLLLIIQLGLPTFPAVAKNFHLSEVTGKNATGIQDLDITISLDWNPETVKKTDADPRGFTKDEFNDVINSFAQSLYSMTNGKHRLRNVYVYTSRHHWDKADVSYISKEAGTAKANVSSWKKSAGRILMYVYEDFKKGKYVLDDSPGPVLAHESGHYIYGLYDEYKETRSDGKTRAQLEKERDFGTPAKDDDGTQKSIMNAHASYPYWFSVDSGYATEVKKNSAQYRMFKKSIWSTLVSDPASDHENAIDDVRTWFDAFKGLSVKSEKDLLAEEDKALDGWDKAPVSIIWMGKTSHFVLVLDNNVSADDWTQSKNSAAAAVRAMTVDNRVSLLAGESVAITNTKLTDANKSAVITQISSAAKATSVPVDKSLRKAFDEIKKLRKYETETATYFIYLFTSGNPAVSSTMKKELTDAKAMLTVAALAKSQASQEEEEGKISVKQLSEESGGKSNVTGRSQKIGSQIARNINFMEAENTSDIAAELFEGTLPPGNSRSMNFVVGPRDTLLTVGMFSDEEEWNDITPSLIDPYGKIIKEGGLPAGVVLEKDQATGIWLFGIDTSIYPDAQGKWSAYMTAVKPTQEPFAMIASAESELGLQVEVTESPLFGYVAKASLKADRPILNARVTAGIYNPDGDLIEYLILKDDGAGGDVKANDGIYSARIRAVARNIEYAIVAWADDNNGQAVESDRGMVFVSNENIIEKPSGAFQRTDESAFTMKLNGSSTGGRCFIAHAAYGSYLDPHVDVLRNFRDNWLLPYGPGQMLVGFYYTHSPDIAALMRQHEAVRFIVMAVLTPIVYSIKYPFLLLAAVFLGIGYKKRGRFIKRARGLFERRK